MDGSILTFNTAAQFQTTPSPPPAGSGCWFSLEVATDQFIITGISSLNGLVTGTTQTLQSISPVVAILITHGLPSGLQGAHQSTTNTRIIAARGDTATIDFSGWGVSWDATPNIDLGAGESNGIATIICDTGSGCANGAGYELDYIATIQTDSTSLKGRTEYRLHLEATISAVSVYPQRSGYLPLV